MPNGLKVTTGALASFEGAVSPAALKARTRKEVVSVALTVKPLALVTFAPTSRTCDQAPAPVRESILKPVSLSLASVQVSVTLPTP